MSKNTNLVQGVYENLVTELLEDELKRLDPALKVHREELRTAEAGDRLAMHLAGVLRRVIDDLDEKKRVGVGLGLVRTLLRMVASEIGERGVSAESPVLRDSVLKAILALNPDRSVVSIEQPLIPLLDTTLLTNAPGEPRVGSQLLTEIASASQIDLVMAFIRFSGIRDFLPGLRRHCKAGKALRILTTTYTNSTELIALEKLREIGAKVRVSYDTSSTRLHAKAWLFKRPGEMSTAYIGSSNLTYSAQRAGLEWNVRISGARNQSVVEKVAAVFDSYWESDDFEEFDSAVFSSRTQKAASATVSVISPLEIRLFPFQERLLEQIMVARDSGRHTNLLVSATGTGKTVMAAVDYDRLRQSLSRSRLLFVAHTKEILQQSLATFRHAVRDAEFGELWVAGERPRRWEHVFASIQSITSVGLDNLAPDHFDVVIVDEIHHGAARSYARLLDHVRPKELLGLTATPERADGLPILDWFGGRIAAELRLWDAIDQHRLVPFDYYGVHDGSDLTAVKWNRGSGYDVAGLTNVYTANDHWAKLVIAQLKRRVGNPHSVRALGFCVSIDHARFMARIFNAHGIKSAAVWGDSPKAERAANLRKLSDGEISVLFSVDIFNEGVDVPNVDTLLLLRPTDSPVLFLQQLGRGLRKAEKKTACLVLDFVGLHRKEFRYYRRLQAFFGGSRTRLAQQVKSGFPFLPAGCHMELEPQAQKAVLQSIRNAIPTIWREKARELAQLASEGHGSLEAFLQQSGLELEDIYQGPQHSWSDLRETAGLAVQPKGRHESTLRRACGRLLHVDDRARLDRHIELLGSSTAPKFRDIESTEARYARMLVASLGNSLFSKGVSLNEGLEVLWDHPQVRDELLELFAYLQSRVDHHHTMLADRPEVPLQIHARYSRVEILAAFEPKDTAKVPTWQTGVRWLPGARADLLAFTLDKTIGQFSPTTRYRDYAISRNLIHWESQGVVRHASETGRRYRTHQEIGSSIYLFARERTTDRSFWFLGPAEFVRSEGERPMAITWRLQVPLPGDLFASFAAAVA